MSDYETWRLGARKKGAIDFVKVMRCFKIDYTWFSYLFVDWWVELCILPNISFVHNIVCFWFHGLLNFISWIEAELLRFHCVFCFVDSTQAKMESWVWFSLSWVWFSLSNFEGSSQTTSTFENSWRNTTLSWWLQLHTATKVPYQVLVVAQTHWKT